MVFTMQEISLYIIIGILAAISYSLRRLYILEMKIEKIDKNIQKAMKMPAKRKTKIKHRTSKKRLTKKHKKR